METCMHVIFRQFEEQNIRYIHFKSNTNLGDSFSGKGDFDVLTDPECLGDAEHIIAQNGGKRFNPPRLGRYPGVDNWMILDESSGVLYHLHLHYQLATGKTLVKDYIIPWSHILFDTRIRDKDYGIYISDPDLELLLLTTRMVLKSTLKQQIRALMGTYEMPSSMKKEFLDLRQKMDEGNFCELARKCGFNDEDTNTILQMVRRGQTDAKAFRTIYGTVRKNMKLQRRVSGSSAFILSEYYSFRRRLSSSLKKRTGYCPVMKKVHDTNGLIVAFVGVDGAGKSTVTKEIYGWLDKKIECKRFYMGSGDGRVPLSMRVFKGLKKTGGNRSETDSRQDGIRTVSLYKNPVKYFRRMFRLKAILDVENNNRKKIEKMQRYRLNGGICLLDRYPQTQVAGMNDGPKIVGFRDHVEPKSAIDRMIRKENEALDIVNRIRPDVVFRLKISAETSMARKPEQHNIEAFRKKIENLDRITFGGARIIDIDAEQPYEQELTEIKRILWSLM